MTNKWLAACVVLMFANLTYAEEGNKKVKQCPDKSKLMNICVSVSFMSLDEDSESNYVYKYQRKIYEASCAEDDYRTLMESEGKAQKDAQAEIVRKVNLMWNQYEDEFKCSGIDFDLTNGSIIKFAVAKGFTSFIVDVAQVWKINLNKIDEADGTTVLDYTQKELERNELS